jgi:hypothetical protein
MTHEEQPIDEVEKRARLFDRMAAQIRLNKDAKFGGAFLLLPPGDGEPVEQLMLNLAEPSIFWASLQTISNMAVASLDTFQRHQGFNRR